MMVRVSSVAALPCGNHVGLVSTYLSAVRSGMMETELSV